VDTGFHGGFLGVWLVPTSLMEMRCGPLAKGRVLDKLRPLALARRHDQGPKEAGGNPALCPQL